MEMTTAMVLHTRLSPRAHSVLIIDDYADIRNLLTIALQDAGYRVRTAQHGVEALEQIESDTFCVIMIDVQMPIMDGVEFVSAYRSLPGHQARLIVMSAGHDARIHAERVGADRYLAKPFDMDVLLSVVGELIDDSWP
jgi:DNA-binding response OmpR family regulator